MDKDTGTFIKGEYKDDTDSQQVILKGDGIKLLSLIENRTVIKKRNLYLKLVLPI